MTIDNFKIDQEKDSLVILQNIRYAPQPDSLIGDVSSDKLLDIYLPVRNNKKELPVFVFVHGGGFAGGDKEGTSEICSRLASKGFAVISINYWLTLKHNKIPGASATANMSQGLPENGKFNPWLQLAIRNASDDLELTLKWIKEHKNEYNFDISKVAVSGGSAGAMTVLHTAYASNQNVLKIKAVVDLWGGLEDVSVIKPCSPPILIYHGSIDKTINVDYAYALMERMEELESKESVLNIMEGKGHARYDIIRNEKIDEIAQFLFNVMK